MNVDHSKSLSCALLSSFTLNQLPEVVSARLKDFKLACRWFVAPFNQYPQLILSENSELFEAAPQLIFLAIALEDILGDLPSLWSAPQKRLDEAGRRISDFLGLVSHLAERLPSAAIFVHDFMPLGASSRSILAAKSGLDIRHLAVRANSRLSELAAARRNVYIVPLAEVFSTQSPTSLSDPRFYYLAKMRLGPKAIESLAEYYSRAILAHAGIRKKCIVVDLDNTLWGGIIGEDGPENLALSDDGPGKAFQDMQRILLDYQESGVLLAICSKNDEALAMATVRDHPGMILRPQHFSAIRINWEDKASNLCALAQELNLGLDSFIFLDDSPFECAEVQRLAPKVTVCQMPADPSDYPAFVAALPHLDTLQLTDDDRRRSQMYVEERQRRDLEQKAGSLEDFLKGLEIQVELRSADKMMLPRVAQLTQRTNQFNLTTRRYTQADLEQLQSSGKWRVYCVSARDRIGDSGVCGAAIVSLDESKSVGRLDTFLLSCRVLGRGVETAFLAGVLSDLKENGMSEIVAEYLPTERNGLAKDFLPKHGFLPQANFWRKPISEPESLCPEWINLQKMK